MSQEGPQIEGKLAIWFNPNSLLSVEFHKVRVDDAVRFLDIIRDALKDAKTEAFSSVSEHSEVLP